MKNLTKIGILVLAISLAFTSCKKIDNSPKINPDGEALGKEIWSKLQDAAQEFTLNINSTSYETIVSEEGMEISFYGNSFKDKDGNIVTGNIDIELIEIYSKADMLLMNKSTMGKLPDGNNAMLKSGGEFRLSAEQNGEALALNTPVFIKIPVENTGGEQADMQFFSHDDDCNGIDDDTRPTIKGKPYSGGCPITDDENVWEEVIEEFDTVGPGGQGGNGGIFVEELFGVSYYTGLVDNFGWTNVDKFISYTGQKTTIKVKAPDAYDHTNIAIYLSYVGEDNALAKLDTYIEDEMVFSEHYGQIPVGQEVYVIAVSVVDGEYSAIIANNGNAIEIVEDGIIVLEDLEPTTEAELVTQINNLP